MALGKNWTTLLGALCIILIAAACYFFFRFATQTARVAFADEQVQVFEAMCRDAVDATPEEAAAKLAYVLTYYPSGTKQVAGSPLDRIVETTRARAISEIIDTLRKKTGEDLGIDPKTWIAKYAKK